MMEPISTRQSTTASPLIPPVPLRGQGGSTFGALMREHLSPSKHAEQRMVKEDICLNSQQQARLERAVSRVEEKGGRQSLVLLDDLAVIVNVRDRTMVTVVSGDRRQDGVFTNIDSTVIAP